MRREKNIFSVHLEIPYRNVTHYVSFVSLQKIPGDDVMENDEDNPKWSTVKVAPYVVKLPLPPDYYLKELRELLANYANEIEYDSPGER